MDELVKMLKDCLPFLKTLQNLHDQRVAPCMGAKDGRELQDLIDSIWQLTRKYKGSKKGEF